MALEIEPIKEKAMKDDLHEALDEIEEEVGLYCEALDLRVDETPFNLEIFDNMRRIKMGLVYAPYLREKIIEAAEKIEAKALLFFISGDNSHLTLRLGFFRDTGERWFAWV